MIYHKIIEISSLSNQEYVKLVGHYNQIGEKTLEKQLLKRNYSIEAINRMKAKVSNQPIQIINSLNVCFQTNQEMKFYNFNYFYTLYRQYSENGVLPFNGCLTDQPSKIIEIFDVFEQLNCEKEEKQIKEIKRKK